MGSPAYDNTERRYRHTDEVPDEGLAAVCRVLYLTRTPAGAVRYDLSFFSGGIGVLDRLAISLPADPAVWATAAAALQAVSAESAAEDEGWTSDLTWLFTGREEQVPLRSAATRFINRLRQPFQGECQPPDRILIQRHSDVNDWAVLWGSDESLNYLGYSQG